MSANWYEIGYTDGVNGRTRGRFNDHREACSKHKIKARHKPYMQGREKGLRRYCTPENGLQEGLDGNSYKNVCPSKSEKGFLRKYRQGKAIYNLKQEINGHESRIDSIKDDLEDKKQKLSDKERKNLKREIRDLRIRIEEKNKRLYYLKGQAGV